MIETEAWGSELASWTPLIVLMSIYGLIVVALLVFGRGSFLERIPNALERLTGIPGWAAASGGTALYGLLVAGQGFYSDVAWHIALGRDQVLFTAPHASIVVGLAMIFNASVLGALFATVQGVDTQLRITGLRVPYSMIPLAALGGAALLGFPLDELWHAQYGIDVTMWSPTHMLMILGASFTGIAVWLVLADAKVSPKDSGWARTAHVLAATLTLFGLMAPLGEFEFGVPQYQQMFHPILVTMAAAFGLIAMRIVLGRGWALGIILVLTGLQVVPLIGFGGGGPVETRNAGIFVVSALVVELTAWIAGTDRRLRFAMVSGVGVATIGLAAEWAWNQGAHQPWHTTLLPDAVFLCLLVGLGAAVVGVAFASCVARERGGRKVPVPALALGGLAVAVAIALPMPRQVGDVVADITLEDAGRDLVWVNVQLDPPGAAQEARWFQVINWQGGGLVLAEMSEVGPGSYRADRPIPVTGRGKALVRLHRGGEMMAAPVFLPADPEIGEPEVPAVDRVVAFTGEQDFLLRETFEGDPWFAYVIYASLGLAGAIWVAAFAYVGGKVRTSAGSPSHASGGRKPLLSLRRKSGSTQK